MREVPRDGALAEIVLGELAQPAPDGVARLAEAVADDVGPATAAVLFYGSCRRAKSSEGVVDFYVLVDAYRAAYRGRGGRALAAANALLPPNVFHRALETEDGPLRCKYAVLSLRDFERGSRETSLQPTVWARFSQPVSLVRVRDEAMRGRVLDACTRSAVAMVRRGLVALPERGDRLRFGAEELFAGAVTATRRAEWRVEPPDRARAIVAADPLRYQRVAFGALEALAEAGELELVAAGGEFEVVWPEAERRRLRRRSARRLPLAKALYFAGLLKSAATFGDWVPYALAKLERHTGTRLELSERQRRHPMVFGWPVLWRLVRERILR